MFAVVDIKGTQYKVAEGDKIKIAKISEEEGKTVTFDEVLLWAKSDKDIEVGTPYAGAKVTCKVLGHGKGEKVRVVKMKKRKRYLRTQGHRQQFTEVEIQKIEKGTAKAAPKKAAPKAETKPAAKKEAPKKAPAAKKEEKKEVKAEKKTEKKESKE